MDSSKIKDVLEELGYKLSDKGSYWQSSALYRGGDNKTALQIYKDTGAWKDYVKDTPFMPFKRLLILTLNTNDPKELSKYLNKDEIFFLNEKAKSSQDKIEMEEVYPESILSNLLPHYSFYLKKGIDQKYLELLKAGLATKGQMYQRFVFPIYNEYGQIHGFSGRDMSQKSDKPKWKHMGRKSNWVYPAYVPSDPESFHENMQKDYVIIVESIGDCLNLMNNGFNNVLVSFGLDISSKLLCSILKLGFGKVFISFNNDEGKQDNRGMEAAIKNYLKLLNYFDKENIKICLPVKNDFGDMDESDFKTWEEKLLLCRDTDQTLKILKVAREMYKQKKLSKNLIKNLKLIDEES
ncbi:MAG: hypothetical protein EBY39_04300 [Flavobacteriia bacterium]|nr:hypothetical protein [Flavobacteriia bacterium]